VKARLVSAESGRFPRELAWLSAEASQRGLVGQKKGERFLEGEKLGFFPDLHLIEERTQAS